MAAELAVVEDTTSPSADGGAALVRPDLLSVPPTESSSVAGVVGSRGVPGPVAVSFCAAGPFRRARANRRRGVARLGVSDLGASSIRRRRRAFAFGRSASAGCRLGMAGRPVPRIRARGIGPRRAVAGRRRDAQPKRYREGVVTGRTISGLPTNPTAPLPHGLFLLRAQLGASPAPRFRIITGDWTSTMAFYVFAGSC